MQERLADVANGDSTARCKGKCGEEERGKGQEARGKGQAQGRVTARQVTVGTDRCASRHEAIQSCGGKARPEEALVGQTKSKQQHEARQSKAGQNRAMTR